MPPKKKTTPDHPSEYSPALPLAEIHLHPKNLRHDATADAEMVASIKASGLLEPLLVAPRTDADGYILIAGHRRYDGLRKAGRTTAPTLIRLDLTAEADQIAAMLVENGRRRDLTPIEEAEGFDLLTELGWDAAKIADAYGCSKTIVAKRRKLTQLAPTHREQIAAGAVTLDDALTLTTLPPAEQKKLEGHAHKSDFTWELARAKDRARRRAEVDREIRMIKKAGGTEHKLPRGVTIYTADKHGLTPLNRLPLPLREPEVHQGCYGWVETGTTQYPSIEPVCSDIASHDAAVEAYYAEVAAQRTADEQAEEARRSAAAAEAEAARAARADAEAARRVAAQMRGEVVLATAQKPHAALVPILRHLTIDIASRLQIRDELVFHLANIPEHARWRPGSVPTQAWEEFVHELDGAALARTFLAVAVARLEHAVESYADEGNRGDPPVLLPYLTALADAGHQPPPVETEIVDRLRAGEARA